MKFNPLQKYKWRGLFYSAALMLCLPALPQRTGAQEITVGTPVTYDASDDDDLNTPAEPIVLKKSPAPKCPKELRKSANYEYAFVCSPTERDAERISKGAGIFHRVEYTNKALTASSLPELRDWKWVPEYPEDHDPRRAWAPIIFNPAEASESGKNTAPRLLEVHPVIARQGIIHPSRPRGVKLSSEQFRSDTLLGATLTIGTDGEIKKAEIDTGNPNAERYESEIHETLARWKFAPARENGIAVEATIKVPVLLIPSLPKLAPDHLRVTTLRAVKEVNTAYPKELKDAGIMGFAVVEFTLDAKGRPQNPVVISMDSKYFEKPALNAIRKYRFEIPNPNSSDTLGRAYTSLADARWQYELGFAPSRIISHTNAESFMSGEGYYRVTTHEGTSISGMNQGPGNSLMTPGGVRVNPSSGIIRPVLPAVMRVKIDHPLSKGRNVFRPVLPPENVKPVAPVYPYSFLQQNLAGKATVRVQFGPNQNIMNLAIIEATHGGFAQALAAALCYYTITPARYKNKDYVSTLTVSFDFDPDNAEQLPPETKRLLDIEQQTPSQIIPSGKLDAPLKLIDKAFIPSRRAATLPQGDAIIEFLVDEQGRARLPRVVQTLTPEAAFIFMQEISMRTYEPPMQNGKPVIARVREMLEFWKDNPAPNR